MNYKRTKVKISNLKIIPQKTKCKTGDNILATIIQMKIKKTYRFIINIKVGIFDVELLIIFVFSVV